MERSDMQHSWEEIPLSELFDFGSGLSKPKADFGSGFGFLSFKDVFYNYFVPDQLGQLVNSTEREQKTCSVRRGDVFLTRTSETQEDLGMSCVALKDYDRATFNGFTKRLRPKRSDQIVPEYAGYFFRSNKFRQDVTAMSSLSTRASLNNEMLGRLKMLLPPIETQKAIGRVLKSFDDKIEVNRHMNATLEAIARALFKAWFVDFEPVHANRENRPSTSASPEIAKLFPSDFENGIPKGWRVGKLGDVLEAKGGTTPSTKNSTFWDGENFWATPKDLSNLRFPVLLKTERKITDEGVRQISSGVLPQGTLLLSSRAPIGYLAISQVPVSINQGFIAIQGKDVSNLYMLFWLKENMESVKSRANGSTFQEISKSSFREVEIAVPMNSVRERFETFAIPIFEKIVTNEIESENLAEIRNSLLPRLISGRIRTV
ncbi:MAG: restriction endonuclease subunit S [Pyrinomonadaceae bacterium]